MSLTAPCSIFDLCKWVVFGLLVRPEKEHFDSPSSSLIAASGAVSSYFSVSLFTVCAVVQS